MQPLTQNILAVFDGYRMAPTAIDQYESTGKTILAERIEKFTATNKPISFAMLGLPFKSTNTRDKVLGQLPDLGEELTVQNFERFNIDIQQVYAPGIKINVASDGLVFNDILGVNDDIVHQYKSITLGFATNSTMQILDLHNFYTGQTSSSTKREKLMQQFGYTWEKMEQEILFNPDVSLLYKSMIRFMEEEIANKPFTSNSQRHKEAKRLAREMMLRNEAYNRLVRTELNDSIRLSMHQSVNNGYKYSFKLIPGAHTMHSPWHASIVMQGNEAITMHRIDAEKAGYQLVYKNGQPYNFSASTIIRDPDGNGNEWIIK